MIDTDEVRVLPLLDFVCSLSRLALSLCALAVTFLHLSSSLLRSRPSLSPLARFSSDPLSGWCKSSSLSRGSAEDMKTSKRVEHGADRRVRELYRYYQHPRSSKNTPPCLPAGEDIPFIDKPRVPDISPAADGTGNSATNATLRHSTAIGPKTLLLNTSNEILTSFAQLAALRLDAEHALICVLDRDMQYIVAEATKSVILDYNCIQDGHDKIRQSTTGSRRAWSLCQVSLLNCVFARSL
jgi:hypothetical protein